MKTARTSLIAACSLAAALFAPVTQAASVQVFTDRAAFEAALTGFSVDSLDGVVQSFHKGTFTRPGYAYSTGDMYGCIEQEGCGSNAMIGLDDAYLWNYKASDTFTFATAVHGFGFDFSDAYTYDAGFAIIDGHQSLATSGFYGVLYSDARYSFTVDQTVSYMMMDNITAGTAPAPAPVPEPSGLALMGLAALVLALVRGRKRGV